MYNLREAICKIWKKLFKNSIFLIFPSWTNLAIGYPIEGKDLLIEGKLIKGSRVDLVRVSD